MNAAWVQLSSGQGPLECQRVVARLVPVFLEEARAAGLRARALGETEGGAEACLASALLSIEGEAATRFAATWEGTVQWRGTSPFRPAHRRKNWFVGVSVFCVPEHPAWNLRDVAIEAFRASGPGGQNVNKVSTAVRVVHRPSGVAVVAREERSQSANRQLALARLDAELRGREEQSEADAREHRRLQHYRLERGNPVRTFRGKL